MKLEIFTFFWRSASHSYWWRVGTGRVFALCMGCGTGRRSGARWDCSPPASHRLWEVPWSPVCHSASPRSVLWALWFPSIVSASLRGWLLFRGELSMRPVEDLSLIVSFGKRHTMYFHTKAVWFYDWTRLSIGGTTSFVFPKRPRVAKSIKILYKIVVILYVYFLIII